MSGGHIFVSFQRFMESHFGVDGIKIDNIEAAVSEIGPDLSTIIGHVDGVEALLATIDADTSAMRTDIASIESRIAILDTVVDNVLTATSEIAESTLRGRQNAGGQLRIADGTTAGTTTSITPSPAPGGGESIRIRFVYFSPTNPNSTTGDTEWHIDNSLGAELGFRCEFSTRIQGHYRFELGQFFHEITTSSFRIRRDTGSDNIHFYIGYTIQDTEGTLP